ncbi:MAG: MobF family relaxase, partial [Stackebrandtia sp.]
MTIHKLSVGDGYTYLTRQVAGGDVQRQRGQAAADYYTQAGNPPGVWCGRGAHLLGLDGKTVTDKAMKALFGDGVRPDAEAVFNAYIAQHKRPGMTAAQLKTLTLAAQKHAQLGRRFDAYKRLDAFDKRVKARLASIAEDTGRAATPAEIAKVKREEASRQRAGVAGFDLVFAPVKSAALVWALHPEPRVRQAVKDAHDAAVDSAMALLEDHAAYTRTGAGGTAQIETKGLIAARFDHFDSRAGDPNLHTHVPVLNKVQGTDGKWRSLDARGLYAMTVATSEHYNSCFEAELAARVGAVFVARPGSGKNGRPVREIVGVPEAAVRLFSRRRLDLEERYRQLCAAYRRAHGHDPAPGLCHKLARQAALDTRPDKDMLRPLAQMRAEWAAELTARFGPDALRQIAAAASADPRPQQGGVRELTPAQIHALADRVVAAVADNRSTWTRWNLHAETQRLLRASTRFADAGALRAAADQVVHAATSPEHSIRIDAPAFLGTPEALRRFDGGEAFTPHASHRYTSKAVLDAEARLVAAAQTHTARGLEPAFVTAKLDAFEATTALRLDSAQRDMAASFATDSRLLAAGLGPAGSGKTTAMHALAHVLSGAGRRLVPLAVSANAAAVLGSELGAHADSLDKFLYEHHAHPQPPPTPDQATQAGADDAAARQRRWHHLSPGDVVLVDEAGMAGTFKLDRLVKIAATHGACVRLLGDWRQLGAVESGGALRLVAEETGAVELHRLHRFADPAAAAASLALRNGEASSLDYFARHSRIAGGSKDAMIEAAYTGWRADMIDGLTSVMIAVTNHDVAALSARARTDRVACGHVETRGVWLHDGNLAGVGDWIVTRHNQRTLTLNRGRDFVRNGTAWRVKKRFGDGSLRVADLAGPSTVTLPAAYVRQHVELAYATTANRIQGATVDTAHPLVTGGMTRSQLYVAATRARLRTVLYAVTHKLLPVDPDTRGDKPSWDPQAVAAREVLENVLARDDAQTSATHAVRHAQTHGESLAALAPRYRHVVERAARDHYTPVLAETLGADTAELLEVDGLKPVVSALLHAETHDWNACDILALAARQGPLHEADSPAALLASRIRGLADNRTPPTPMQRPSRDETARYARLARRRNPQLRLDPDTALTPPPAAPHDTAKASNTAQRISAKRLHKWAEHAANRLGLHVHDVTAHPAWPHLATTLARTEASGADPAAVLNSASPAAAGADPRHTVATLARAARRLAPSRNHPDVTLPPALACHAAALEILGPATASRARNEKAWPALAAAVSRAASCGVAPAEALR